jgi:hypothetical protein
VSLSQPAVQKVLNQQFICAWTNIEGQPHAGMSFAHKPTDPPPSCVRGNGEHNIQYLFLTPEGELFHVLAGYLSPADLAEELRFATATFDALRKTRPDQRHDVVVNEQKKFLAAYERKPATGFFAFFERGRVVADHRFTVEHPLLPASEFRPEMLVGNGVSFFGSMNGKMPGGMIGGPPGLTQGAPRSPGKPKGGN